ncbi:unnamed protein product [Strongylus vulgaris]|uniref:Uncharacterized protein n=1 Tax=Strongylus vulgaris TaxID=40348 RepID=A0A3P7KNB7_STRVU|nr:unnamed protein product [Strongylus vulgaris]
MKKFAETTGELRDTLRKLDHESKSKSVELPSETTPIAEDEDSKNLLNTVAQKLDEAKDNVMEKVMEAKDYVNQKLEDITGG